MAPLIPSVEPRRLVAGDTWQWTRPDHAEYPISEGWTLSYAIRGADAPEWDAAWATNDGAVWTVVIPANKTTLTVSPPASLYHWSALMTGTSGYSGRRSVVATGRFQVFADPRAVGPGEMLDRAYADLEAVRAAKSGQISAGMQEYTIGGRSVVKMTMAELYREERRLEAKIWQIEHPGEIGPAIAWRFR